MEGDPGKTTCFIESGREGRLPCKGTKLQVPTTIWQQRARDERADQLILVRPASSRSNADTAEESRGMGPFQAAYETLQPHGILRPARQRYLAEVELR